ncbi:UDP-N-acetylmuramoyl-tripeptide--D-alanyl-D-alanine ligase [Polaribacter sp. Hel1_85]|uniref:UDP-N-acetylmuramoyl-tripeptide--D-alanyl-D- alanine ligase n=1 Tax=Polaribacter sp. Hel1_85 TaxID=1250005 RepID=UPI00052E0E1E|nr:UDP-N-acetylmuramoyl-tripeptide--D-alanyl-D-alanine ligase [Polaribacter sp. Hel1_85]KGL64340.1 UDP-N-acetylmuramoylalanyl-D-glutamyl-2,6- diaminopimelate-D-alanyl-D-alanine ligase [Polaribacter sp. Hel1_85]
MKIKDIYKLYANHFLVDTDTRKIRKNTIFFALKGDNFNGNKFAEKALELGAIYAIVDEIAYCTHPHIILVDNVLETLQKLANYHRNILKTTIIGLTGSNGKTTTKELINAVLSKKHKTTATVGNLNNHIGVPLTLLSMTPETEIGIVEMGANHQKEIAFLCSLCEPDFGYITNFGKAHLEGFGGIEGVIQGKSELYTYLENNNKTAFINPEDPIQVEKTKRINNKPFCASLKFIEVNPFVKLSFNTNIIQSNLIGKYNYTNIAIACTIGNHFKVSDSDVKSTIEEYVPNNNRSQIIKKKSNRIILDAYNANPSSMKAALENFESINAEFKTVILGDMFELGETSIEEHKAVINLVKKLGFNTTYFVGENFYQTKTKHHLFRTYEDLLMHLKNNPLKHQSILIKGSRGMRLERLLDIII